MVFLECIFLRFWQIFKYISSVVQILQPLYTYGVFRMNIWDTNTLTIFSCNKQWRPLHHILSLYISSMAHQHLESFHTVVLGCIMERRLKVVECTNVHVRYGRSRKKRFRVPNKRGALIESPCLFAPLPLFNFSVFNLSTALNWT